MATKIDSKRGLARHCGCSDAAIRKLYVRRELPTRYRAPPTRATPWTTRKADGFNRWRDATLADDPAVELLGGGRRRAEPYSALREQSVRLKRSRADLVEMEVRVLRGELVDKAKFDAEFRKKIFLTRQTCLDCARRVGPRLAGKVLTEDEIEEVFAAEANVALLILAGKRDVP